MIASTTIKKHGLQTLSHAKVCNLIYLKIIISGENTNFRLIDTKKIVNYNYTYCISVHNTDQNFRDFDKNFPIIWLLFLVFLNLEVRSNQ